MALRAIGRGFIGLGTLILLFLLYQLVGTNLVTGRQQKALASEVKEEWATGVAEAPVLGNGMALIKIPKIGVDAVVVEGVEVEDLKKGPGHYPDTALPGQLGNMVISGHRTTYGAPFYRLDELKPGDEITVFDARGPYTYRVTESKVVLPTEIGVIAPSSDARLTLTTCHPRFSAAKRLIVVAQLEGTPTGLQTTDPGAGVLPES
jgi:sortase A